MCVLCVYFNFWSYFLKPVCVEGLESQILAARATHSPSLTAVGVSAVDVMDPMVREAREARVVRVE